ncbi:hypothetical protein [Levilactobacillus brevis]|uniref:hypothetical protein n=1 Tax=Levilactobacillus brevis TaxID=1580 RepID=UPI000BEACC51|nr:hypothetical protein [Levilactobacillus brevis]STX20424.1 Uncharacterised protein [Levilactobacillus brevis]
MKPYKSALLITSSIIIIAPILSGCGSSNTETGKKLTKAEIRQQRVDKSAKILKSNPTDKNYLNLLKTELGNNHVVELRQSPHKYTVAKLKGFTFNTENKYRNFGKTIRNIMINANKAGYVKAGLGFVQRKDGFTSFTFAYSRKDIKDGELSKSALKNDYDPVFENATSFYIEPFFKQDTKNNIMTDSDVNAGPIVGPDKKSLNTEIMETFDD